MASCGRVAVFLRDITFLLVGRTVANHVVAATAAALGASTRWHDGPVESLGGAVVDGDIVVCDQIGDGCGGNYLRAVSNLLGDSRLRRVRVWVSVSAFGIGGPAGGYRGCDLVCAAAGGLLYAVTDARGRLRRLPRDQALRAAGQVAILAALHGLSQNIERAEPVHIDVSAQEAVVFCAMQQDVTHVMHRCNGRSGAGRYTAPTGVFDCTDGLVRIMVLEDHQFARLAEVVGRPDWPRRFPSAAQRRANAQTINTVVRQWAAERSKLDCERLLQANAVPATAVRGIDEFRDCAQARARDCPGPGGFPGLITFAATRAGQVAGRTISGLRVVEATNVLAGPLTGAILAAMGAEVVRLEDDDRLDVYRRTGPYVRGKAGVERSAYFMAANYGKRSVRYGDSELGARALSWGDVLIENVGLQRLARMGLTARPGLPTVSISAFGRTGPQADWRGYAPNIHAFAGLEAALREATGLGVTIRTPFADLCTAVVTATAVAAWRLGGGSGVESIDLAMSEVISEKLTELGDGGPVADLTIQCGDGQLLALEALQAQNGPTADIVAAIRDAAPHHADAAAERLQKAGVPAYPVRAAADLPHDQQLTNRGFFSAAQHPVVGEQHIIGLPWKVVGEPRPGYRRAPLLGEHDAWARKTFKNWPRGND